MGFHSGWDTQCVVTQYWGLSPSWQRRRLQGAGLRPWRMGRAGGGANCTQPPAWAQPGVSTGEAAPPHYVPPPSTGGRWAGPPPHPPGRSVAPRTMVLTSRPSGVAASKVSAWHGSTEGEKPGHGDGPEGCWPHQGLEKYKGTDARGLSAQGGRGDASSTGSDTISPWLLGHPAGVCEQEGTRAAVSGDGPFGGH